MHAYHVTPIGNVPGILAEGLRIEHLGKTSQGVLTADAHFCAPDEATALLWMYWLWKSSAEETFALFEVDLTGLPHSEAERFSGCPVAEIRVEIDVPAKRLRHLRDLHVHLEPDPEFRAYLERWEDIRGIRH